MLFAVFSTFLLVPDVAAQEPGKIIEALDILGNRRLTDEEILKHIKTRPGKQFDKKQTQEDLDSLFKLGLFDRSNTRVITEAAPRGGVHVIFEIREWPIIVEVEFKGLRYITKAELLAELSRHKAEVTANRPFHLEKMEKLRKARRIITNYVTRQRGFASAKVFVSHEDVSASTVAISFVIDEVPGDDDP